MCDRTGLTSIYEIVKGDKGARELGKWQGYGLCLPSLHPNSQANFRAEDWEDALIIIDECEQVLWEALHSSTCKDHRVSILRSLRDLIDGVLSPTSSGRLVIADADLSDQTVNTIRGMAREYACPPWVAVSNYKGHSCEFTSYECVEQLLMTAEERITNGEKLFVVTDSQKGKSRFSTTSLEARWKELFPHLKILRIDSETLNRKNADAYGCMGLTATAIDFETRKAVEWAPSINFLLAQYDIVIVSPSLETGVSIDIKGHFNRVIGFYSGVMAENSVRQSLARLRENVPRDIHVAPRGLSVIGGGELNATALEASEHKQVSAALRLIFDAARDQIDTAFLPAATHAYAQFAARHNAGTNAYREVIHGALRDEGHRLSVIHKPDKDTAEYEDYKQLGKELSSARNIRLINHSTDIGNAEDLEEGEAKKLAESRTVDNEAQALALKKAQLKKRYPGAEITPDLNILDEHGWHPKIKLHYRLTQGREYLKAADQEKIESIMSAGAVWASDVRRYTLSIKVAVLEFFGIAALLELESISNEHPQIVELAQKSKGHINEIKGALGFTISAKDSPVVIARKFLNTVGFGLGKAVRVGEAGAQVRHYPVEQIDFKELAAFGPDGYDTQAYTYQCDRTVIFKEWLAKDLAKKAALTMAENDAAAAESPPPLPLPESQPPQASGAIVSKIPIVSAGSNRSIQQVSMGNGHSEISLKESAQIALAQMMLKFRDWQNFQLQMNRLGSVAKEAAQRAFPPEAIARFKLITQEAISERELEKNA